MEPKSSNIITFITDFGTLDYYVGAMKGVCLGINPSAHLVDLTHDIPPGNIRYAAYVVSQTCPRFPAGTIHLVVVDPGVGGGRRPVALSSRTGTFVGPDNGVFTTILESGGVESVVEITESRYFARTVSPTFHGRDIFAPIAAHLSIGDMNLLELGRTINDPVRLEAFEPEEVDDTLFGCIIHCDHFGNLVTNVTGERLIRYLSGSAPVIEIGGTTISGLNETYSQVEKGSYLALIGGSELLEISVNRGNAGKLLGVSLGERVVIRRGEAI
jgi:S-adenosylmethionine hydrolase